MAEVSREEWERAQAAFYPFIQGFEMPLNPEDVDEILYAVLRHSRSTADPEQITAEVDEQIHDYLERTRRMWKAMGENTRATDSAASGLPGPWVLWRQDDHGNRFEVGRYQVREAADHEAAALESRGHKQMYWVAHQES